MSILRKEYVSWKYSLTFYSSQLNFLDIFVHEWHASFPTVSVNSFSFFFLSPLCITSSVTFPFISISNYSSALVTRPEFASRKSALTILPNYGLFCPPFSVVTMWEVRAFIEESGGCSRYQYFLKAPQVILMNRQDRETLEPIASLINPSIALKTHISNSAIHFQIRLINWIYLLRVNTFHSRNDSYYIKFSYECSLIFTAVMLSEYT